MYIDLTNKTLDKAYDFELIANGDDRLFEGRNIEFVSPMKLKGSYTLFKERVEIKATLRYSLKANCDKCLKSVQKDYSITINEIFFKDSPNSDEYSYSDYIVNLNDMVREKILLNLEEKILCKDDCKGICPVCGSDLNLVECDCKTEDKNNPFAILKSIVGGSKNGSTKK